MRKIYNLRRIAVLLIVFGLGLIVGNKKIKYTLRNKKSAEVSHDDKKAT